MNESTIPQEIIKEKIFLIRNQKVMLDHDLAELYGVLTKVLNQAVKRNSERFPLDFMFQLNKDKTENVLRSQFVTSKHGGRRFYPYAFTEQGVAMLSSALNSPRAIQVNIQIMRTFNRLRTLALGYEELKRQIDQLEDKSSEQFAIIFQTLENMILDDIKPVRKIGFSAT